MQCDGDSDKSNSDEGDCNAAGTDDEEERDDAMSQTTAASSRSLAEKVTNAFSCPKQVSSPSRFSSS